MSLSNDPAANPEVERVARIFCGNKGQSPDELNRDGDPLWRAFVQMALSAIEANRIMTS